MQSLLAEYIDRLHWALTTTHEATDRSIYTAYLADAAVLLARAVAGADAGALRPLVEAHERLRAQSWPRGEEHGVVDQAWARARQAAVSRPAT
jgi:hypothetical protein